MGENVFKKLNSHATLMIGCPTGGHAAFKAKKGKAICVHCKKDFTANLKAIYFKIGEMLSIN